jgi:hypothetical protein
MPPASLAQDILSDRLEPYASSSHGIPLSLWRKEGPKLNPVSHHMNNRTRNDCAPRNSCVPGVAAAACCVRGRRERCDLWCVGAKTLSTSNDITLRQKLIHNNEDNFNCSVISCVSSIAIVLYTDMATQPRAP